MSNLVTIFGGSGFVGRYIARHFAKQGWRVRVAVRRPNEALFVKPYGKVGQVEPILCNIRDDVSVSAAMSGADVVINCVGTFDRSGRNNFNAVQAEGAARIARLSGDVARLVHISAIGADPDAESDYLRTKGEGEAAILEARPDAVILRPSVIFGAEDGFFNRFAWMTNFGPVLPITRGDTLFQPVYVDDVALAAVSAATGEAKGVYELGGPEVASLRDLIGKMLDVINRRRLVMNLPVFAARIGAFFLDLAQTMTLGLLNNSIITRDQAKSLAVDNVVAEGAKGLDDLGVKPTPMGAILPSYLWRFRPSGQYDAIKESAGNLRS